MLTTPQKDKRVKQVQITPPKVRRENKDKKDKLVLIIPPKVRRENKDKKDKLVLIIPQKDKKGKKENLTLELLMFNTLHLMELGPNHQQVIL